jgi:hypothetical protein
MLMNFHNNIYYVQQDRCAVDEQLKAAFKLAVSDSGGAACCFLLLSLQVRAAP